MSSLQTLRPGQSHASLVRALLGFALMAAAAWAISSSSLEAVILAVVVAGSALLLLRWPWMIWLAMAFSLSVASAYRLGPVSGTEAFLLLAAGLWLIDGARRRSLRVYSHPVVLLPLLYAGVQLLSLLGAASLREGVPEVVKWVEFALVMLLLPAMVPARAAIWVAASMVAGAAAQALLGVYQFAYQVGPEWFVLFDRFMRASGTFRQPNPYAAYLGALLPLAVSVALWSWVGLSKRGSGWRIPLVLAVYFTAAAVVIVAGILASWSRGGWLAAAVSLLVIVAVRNRWAVLVTLVSGIGLILAFAAASLSTNRLAIVLQVRLQGMNDMLHPAGLLEAPVTDDNFAVIERLAHWVAGYRMWETAPWTGIGAGNYAMAYDNVRLPIWTEPLGHAHNLYLNILAETGLVGMAAFLVMWIGLAVWAWRRLRASDLCSERWSGAVSAAILGTIVYLTIHSIVDVLFVQGIYLTLALSIAVLASGCAVEATDLA